MQWRSARNLASVVQWAMELPRIALAMLPLICSSNGRAVLASHEFTNMRKHMSRIAAAEREFDITTGQHALNRMLLIVVVMSFLLSGCGKPDLSRADAEKLITTSADESLKLLTSHVLLHTDGSKEAQSLGITLGASLPDDSPLKGEASGVGGVRLATTPFSSWPALMMTKQVKVDFLVSGLALDGDQTRRTADFSWRYANLPKYSSIIVAAGGTGKAEFRLYDDGWRLTSVLLMDVSKERYAVDNSVRSEVVGELRAAVEAKAEAARRKRAEEEARRVAAEAERRRLQEEQRLAAEAAAAARKDELLRKRSKIEAALSMGSTLTVFSVDERSLGAPPRRRELHVFAGGFTFKWFDLKLGRYVLDRAYPFGAMQRTTLIVNRSRPGNVQVGREGGWPSNDAQAEAAYRRLEAAYAKWQVDNREALSYCAHAATWTCSDPR